jgi:hypothetical protein
VPDAESRSAAPTGRVCLQASGSSRDAASVSARSTAAIKDLLKAFKVDPKAGFKDAAQSAHAEGCRLAAFGQVIVVASIDGVIQLYENTGAPRWL